MADEVAPDSEATEPRPARLRSTRVQDANRRIDELVSAEHRLWEAEPRGEATEGDRQRLDELKVTLDQCWDRHKP
jgi:Protein of unknown function (DUF2630)